MLPLSKFCYDNLHNFWKSQNLFLSCFPRFILWNRLFSWGFNFCGAKKNKILWSGKFVVGGFRFSSDFLIHIIVLTYEFFLSRYPWKQWDKIWSHNIQTYLKQQFKYKTEKWQFAVKETFPHNSMSPKLPAIFVDVWWWSLK